MLLKIYKIDNEYIKEISITVFKVVLFSIQKHKNGGWFRIFNFGISWTRIPPFSVKNGYKKSLKIKNNYFTLI